MSFINPGDPELANKFYRTIYFSFGLPSSYRMSTSGTKEIKMGWDYKTLARFEINGRNLVPHLFVRRGPSNIFECIERDISVPRRYEWAFDTTLLSQGKLKGKIVVAGTKEKVISDAYRSVLTAIGDAVAKRLITVPAVELEFGELWDNRKIPDVISIGFNPVSPMEKYHMESLMEQISYAFNVMHHDDIHGEARWNLKTSQFELTFQVKLAPQEPPIPAPPAHVPQNSSAEPVFPFEFYRGLGLIDDEGYVIVPTFLGPVRVHCMSEMGMEYLMNYQPE